MPLNMPVYRVTCFANGGRRLHDDRRRPRADGRRQVATVDEAEVMERAQVAADRMLERTGLRHLLDAPATLWRAAHY